MRGLVHLLPLLALAAALAQQTAPVYRATANLVIVNVSVQDRGGRDVVGLSKEDFTVLEDGKPQTIAIFEHQRLDPPPEPPTQLAARPQAESAAAEAGTVRIATPGKVQYQNRRLLVLFFDHSSMPAADQARAHEAALKFIREQMRPEDLVAVMTFGAQLKVEQDFTDDRDALIRVIGSFRTGEASELAAESQTDEEAAGDEASAYTPDESEFNIFNTDRKLGALEKAARMLAALPEKKALIYFSSGVSRTGVENESQLRATINAALRANVSFYPVDARGLVATVAGGDASQASPSGTGIFSGRTQRSQMERFLARQDTLVALAEDTGGRAFLDANDLTLGIRQAQRDIRSYYILGYYPTNQAQDGRFRRIQVRLNRPLQAKLDYRRGYFAPKDFSRFNESDREQQLEEALALGDPITDLPLALEVNYFRLASDRYFVPVSVKIPGSEITLARRGSTESTELDFIGQVRDSRGRAVATVRDGIRVRLRAEDVVQLEHRNFQYDTGFTLPPGRYRLKFLVRENQLGRIGTFETPFEVPDLASVKDRLRLSSLVLASQREPLAAVVGAATRDRKLLAANPLVENNLKLAPSVTRVFRRDQNLYVYVEAYDPAADPADRQVSVVGEIAFLRGRRKAFQSQPVRLTQTLPARPGVLPVRFELPLKELVPGPYVCQVTLVDQVGKRFGFARVPVVILP
ncbi:MAG: VWA domain-containing protein [Bryobacterales bacterium]|nr:VWA domain-containing protein [Bryobacteraceae bacterium]MDW8131495.1 VWA domain-containing protein [Bryobacterales bacterium]